MESGAELIRKIKEQIEEVDPRDVHELQQNGNGNGAVIVDVREQHEFEAAHLPGAVHVPRGYLESRMKFPGTPGFFTAFWMLPTNPSFSYNTEIDIVEILGGHPANGRTPVPASTTGSQV